MSNNNSPPGVGGPMPGGQASSPQGGQVQPPGLGANGWPIIPEGWPAIPGGQAPPPATPAPTGNTPPPGWPAGWPNIPGQPPGAPSGQNPSNDPNNPPGAPSGQNQNDGSNKSEDDDQLPTMWEGEIPEPGEYPGQIWGPPKPPGPGFDMVEDNRPRTPWAERFGRMDSMFYHLNPSSSGFSPQYPQLHPKYHGETPDAFNIPNGWAELDKFLYNHELQAKRFEGARAWQLPVLHTDLSLADNDNPMKGGNTEDCRSPEAQKALRERYDRERYTVNEDTWFSFLRKDRWFTPKLRAEVFSVDRDELWSELRVIIELANRMLKTLIEQKHEWMDTILWGTIALWSEVQYSEPYERARVLIPHRVEVEYCQKTKANRVPLSPYMKEAPKEEHFEEWEKLLERLVWTFSESGKVQAWGYFNTLKRQPSIWLESGQLESLLSEDITMAERTFIVTNIAFTHATVWSRLHESVRVTEYAQLNEREKLGVIEPFYNFEEIAEVGESWENSVFGALLTNIPGPVAERAMQKNRPDKRLIPLSCTGKEWPSRDACLGYLGTQKLALELDELFALYGPRSKISHVPVSYQYMLLTQAFWDAEGPKDFHIPDIIVTTSDRDQPTGYLPKIEVSRDSEFLKAHKNTADRFDERIRMWTEATNRIPFPWIEEWSTTPWGEIKRRMLVDEFRRQFKNRNELACHDISSALLAMFQPGDPEALPVPGSRDNNDWIFGVIGLIMKAAIPIRYKSYFFFKEIDWLRAFPAERARAAGKNFSLWAADGDWGCDRIPKTEVSHPVLGSDMEDPTHHAFLDAADHLMAVVDLSGADQPAIWVQTLQRAVRMLRRLRDEDRDEESWADLFPWKVPDYDGAMYVRWIPGKPFNEPFPTKYEHVD